MKPKDAFAIDLNKVFDKHKIKKLIALVEHEDIYRVMLFGDAEELDFTDYAKLINGCLEVSPGFKEIVNLSAKMFLNEIIDNAAKEAITIPKKKVVN